MKMQRVLKTFIYVFLVLAAVGFACTLLIYLEAFFGQEKLERALTPLLAPGIFVVWFPTVLVMARMTRFGDRQDVWKITLSGCPLWLRRGLYGVVGFGTLNFVYFALRQRHGPVSTGLFMGGHFMIFYGIASCVMYSAIHAPALLTTRMCSLGHKVSPLATYCPICGASVADNNPYQHQMP